MSTLRENVYFVSQQHLDEKNLASTKEVDDKKKNGNNYQFALGPFLLNGEEDVWKRKIATEWFITIIIKNVWKSVLSRTFIDSYLYNEMLLYIECRLKNFNQFYLYILNYDQ